MENLTLFKQEQFHGFECDLWSNENDDILMTANQLGTILGYVDPRRAINKIVRRNEYLESPEFSVVTNLVPTSLNVDTRVFTEDGIYEVAMLSKSEMGKEFRKWIRGLLKGMRKNEITILQTKLLEQQEKVDNYNLIGNANNNLSMLKFARGLRLGRNKLFTALRENKILMSAEERKNIPYQPFIDRGLFHTILGTVINGNKVKDVVITTVTPKGIDFLVNFCKKKGLISATCEFNPNV